MFYLVNLELDETVIDDDCLESRRQIVHSPINNLFTHTNSGVFDCEVRRMGLEENHQSTIEL